MDCRILNVSSQRKFTLKLKHTNCPHSDLRANSGNMDVNMSRRESSKMKQHIEAYYNKSESMGRTLSQNARDAKTSETYCGHGAQPFCKTLTIPTNWYLELHET